MIWSSLVATSLQRAFAPNFPRFRAAAELSRWDSPPLPFLAVTKIRILARHLKDVCYVLGGSPPEKGVHVLLDAFELIVRRYPDATLTIVGPEWIAPREDITDLCLEKDVVASLGPFYKGSYLSQLKQKLTPEAAKQVTFAGLVLHADVPNYYQDADIYVSPSFYLNPLV